MASEPHSCPNCEGTGKIKGRECESCDAGVVWSPHEPVEAADSPASSDPLELKGI